MSAIDTAAACGLVADVDQADLDAARHAWTRNASERLTSAYLESIGESELVPADRADADLLLDVFVLYKGMYEIRYELANRPDWVHWPLTAVVEMIGD